MVVDSDVDQSTTQTTDTQITPDSQQSIQATETPVSAGTTSAVAAITDPSPTPSPTDVAATDSNLGFMDARGIVADAKAIHDRIHASLTSAQAAVIAEADKAMAEVEGVFSGPIHDENVRIVNAILEEAGLLKLSMEEKIKATENFLKLKLNEYFIVQGKAFIMTGDRKIQEAGAYVNRLEKTTIQMFRDKQAALKLAEQSGRDELEALEKLAANAEIMVRGFWGRLKFAFTGK